MLTTLVVVFVFKYFRMTRYFDKLPPFRIGFTKISEGSRELCITPLRRDNNKLDCSDNKYEHSVLNYFKCNKNE